MACFNSMKVRLKRVKFVLSGSGENEFQFHEGPIKTNITNTHSNFGVIVSIP